MPPLSDKEKRAKYDRGGHAAFGSGFDPFAGSDASQFDFGLGDISSIFEMFGIGGTAGGRTRAPGRPARGRDVRLEMRVSFETAVRGGEVDIVVPHSGERVKVRLPVGIEDGATLRIAGRGSPAHRGGRPGDAYVTVHVSPDAVFRREGRDLYCDVTVGLAAAGLGDRIDVVTLDGTATIRMPAGTRSGQKLRLKGRGVPASASGPAGDLYTVVQIQPPKRLDARSRELLEEFAKRNPVP